MVDVVIFVVFVYFSLSHILTRKEYDPHNHYKIITSMPTALPSIVRSTTVNMCVCSLVLRGSTTLTVHHGEHVCV